MITSVFFHGLWGGGNSPTPPLPSFKFPPQTITKFVYFLDVFHIFSPQKSNFPPKTTFIEKNPVDNSVPAVDNCSVHMQCVGKEQSIPANYWGESVSPRVCSPIRPTSFVNMATSAQRTLLGILIWCTYAAGNFVAIAYIQPQILCYSYMLYRRDCIVHIVYVSTCLLYVLRIKKRDPCKLAYGI